MQSKLIGLAATAFVGAVAASTAWAADNSAFLQDAIKGSMAEVKLGKLAQQSSGSADAKSFGQRLVTDHTSAMDKAEDLAKFMKVTVPTEPSSEAQAKYDKLHSLTGAAFDKKFADHMVKGHEQTIQEFEEQASGSGKVAEYAKATLPTLKEHLDIVQKLEAQQK